MKLTWFGGTAVRLHIGGEILVLDPQSALAGIDPAEIVSGANRVLGSSDASLVSFDAEHWRPQRRGRLLDESTEPPVAALRLGRRSVFVTAVGEPQVALVSSGDYFPAGRWAEDAVIVLFGVQELAGGGGRVLLEARPRLIALAVGDEELGPAMTVLQDRMSGSDAVLMSLEPEMAVEL